METVHRDSLPKNRFEGVRECRLVMDSRVFGDDPGRQAWQGLGNFVYLADASLIPKGQTMMHDHREIDVITVMLKGRLEHEGSLEHGQSLSENDVQVQRAGGEGFSHNEINPDDSDNRLLQIWVLPERKGEPAAYRLYKTGLGGSTRIYGGEPGQHDAFPSVTCIEILELKALQSVDIDVPCLAYLARGEGFVSEDSISEGCLIRAEQLTFDATEDSQLLVIHAGR